MQLDTKIDAQVELVVIRDEDTTHTPQPNKELQLRTPTVVEDDDVGIDIHIPCGSCVVSIEMSDRTHVGVRRSNEAAFRVSFTTIGVGTMSWINILLSFMNSPHQSGAGNHQL